MIERILAVANRNASESPYLAGFNGKFFGFSFFSKIINVQLIDEFLDSLMASCIHKMD